MTSFLAIFIFLVGLSVGSFLNVLIYRLPRNESIIFPASHCPSCGKILKWWENIPLLSFLILKRRCRYCSTPISFRYPLVELLTALLFLTIFFHFGLSFRTLFALFFGVLLVAVGVIDLKHQIIPNKLVFPGLGIGFVGLFLTALLKEDFLPLAGKSSIFYSFLGLAGGGGFLFLFALIKEEWMGGGDVKLAALMGLFLGGYVFLALVLGSFVGAIVGLSLIISRRIERKTPIPFGPFLVLGALVTLFFGPQIFSFYLSLWR